MLEVIGSSFSHHDDVIMGAMASQITSLMIVYSTVYSGADQSKYQSSASLAFVWGPGNSPHKWLVTRQMFPFDDVIMLVCFPCHLAAVHQFLWWMTWVGLHTQPLKWRENRQSPMLITGPGTRPWEMGIDKAITLTVVFLRNGVISFVFVWHKYLSFDDSINNYVVLVGVLNISLFENWLWNTRTRLSHIIDKMGADDARAWASAAKVLT